MRRCFIAIFALHFFLSVSAFAFGDLQGAQLVQAHAAGVAQTEMTTAQTGANQDPGTSASSASHALVDEVPDLPDSLPRIFAAQRPPVDGGSTIAFRQRAAVTPSLDGLLRPPQQAQPTA